MLNKLLFSLFLIGTQLTCQPSYQCKENCICFQLADSLYEFEGVSEQMIFNESKYGETPDELKKFVKFSFIIRSEGSHTPDFLIWIFNQKYNDDVFEMTKPRIPLPLNDRNAESFCYIAFEDLKPINDFKWNSSNCTPPEGFVIITQTEEDEKTKNNPDKGEGTMSGTFEAKLCDKSGKEINIKNGKFNKIKYLRVK